MNIPRKRINIDNESGFASLVVASVLIVVLSLMTVGFAQLMRSNQTSALNKQLSDQAYYAAESGINDAAQAYNAGYSLSKTACGANTDTSISDSTGVDTNLPGYQYLVNPSINTSTSTSVTCLLTDPTPQTIEYTVYPSQPTVVEMQGCTTVQSDDPTQACGEGTAANANDINISWQDIVSGSAPAPGLASSTCSSLGSETSWNAQNMLRIELVPLSSSGTITRADLINDSYTAYLCPDGTSGGATYAVSGNTGVDSGQILSSSCTVAPGASGTNPPHLCSVHLNVGPLNDSTYFLIMRGIYNNPVQATATMTGSTGLLNIGDAQMLVDSTGQAQNILKRVQARIPESNEYNLPNAAVQGEVCKQIEIGPTTEYAPNESTDDSPCSTGVNSIRSAITP